MTAVTSELWSLIPGVLFGEPLPGSGAVAAAGKCGSAELP
jgi:hypothetical protein